MAAPVAAKVAVTVARSKTGQRMIAAILALILAIVSLPALLIGFIAFGAAAEALCEDDSYYSEFDKLQKDGAETTQQANAQIIIEVGEELSVPLPGVKIALMVALVETNLQNLANTNVRESLNYPHDGEGSDHDSLGLFQQRPSAGWGTVEELMDPREAAIRFYGGAGSPNAGNPPGLLDISDWETMDAGKAAQAVQVSKYPDRYAEREAEAESMLLGSSLAGVCDQGTGDTGSVDVVGGWANPVGTQPWTTRADHSGGAMDVEIGVGTPIYAPAVGTILDLSETCGGTVIGVQHNNQYTTVFAHLSQVFVREGQTVTAGQKIALSGESGVCVNGAHLHFEVRVGPTPKQWGTFTFTPAFAFMKRNGIIMGPCKAGCDLYESS